MAARHRFLCTLSCRMCRYRKRFWLREERAANRVYIARRTSSGNTASHILEHEHGGRIVLDGLCLIQFFHGFSFSASWFSTFASYRAKYSFKNCSSSSTTGNCLDFVTVESLPVSTSFAGRLSSSLQLSVMSPVAVEQDSGFVSMMLSGWKLLELSPKKRSSTSIRKSSGSSGEHEGSSFVVLSDGSENFSFPIISLSFFVRNLERVHKHYFAHFSVALLRRYIVKHTEITPGIRFPRCPLIFPSYMAV